MPGGGPPSVRPLRSGAVTGGKSGGSSGSLRVGATLVSGNGRAATWGRDGDDGCASLGSSLVPEGLGPPSRPARRPSALGSRLTGGLATCSSRIEGSLGKRPGGGALALGPTCGAASAPGVEDGTPVAPGGSRMRTRRGESVVIGRWIPTRTRSASNAPCRRNERPKVLFRLEWFVTIARPNDTSCIIGKHLSWNKENWHPCISSFALIRKNNESAIPTVEACATVS